MPRQGADSSGLLVRRGTGGSSEAWWAGAHLPPGRPVPRPGEGFPSVVLPPPPAPPGSAIAQPGDQRMRGFHSTHHPRLFSPQPWEGSMPSGRHPSPTKTPLLELEVRICGRWDSWVRVPAPCQSPGRWTNISGIRSAACLARPLGARRCRALRLHRLCQGFERLGGERES